jgi:SAM-dependent methyltransferase
MTFAAPASHWYREAFGPLTAGFWTSFTNPTRIDADVRFLARHLGAGLALDVCCGAGLHARAMGRRGWQVHGIDVSPHMLAASVEPAVPGVTFEQREMTALDAVSAYDAAYCWGNSFGYISDAESRDFLARVQRALRPGARFVLETGAVAENMLAKFQPRTELDTNGYRFLAERRYDAAESAMHIHYRVKRGGEVEDFVARQCVYTIAEIVRMAAAAGLTVDSLHGGVNGEAPGLGRGLIAVFRRAG